jgi:hypothetical protein
LDSGFWIPFQPQAPKSKIQNGGIAKAEKQIEPSGPMVPIKEVE